MGSFCLYKSTVFFYVFRKRKNKYPRLSFSCSDFDHLTICRKVWEFKVVGVEIVVVGLGVVGVGIVEFANVGVRLVG